MIDELDYNQFDYLKRLAIAYRKIHDRDSELRVIEKYFNGDTTHSKKADWWFKNRLKELNQKEITFSIEEYNLDKNPFFEYNKKLDLEENLKRKAVLIKYGDSLNTSDAISYFKYLCNNTYFSNDWYPYRRLTEIYSKINDYNANLVNIKKLLQSKIYLNEYQFLYFSEKIRQLSSKCSVDENTIQKWLDDYEINGSVNKFKLNKYLADKFMINDTQITVQNDDEFQYEQGKLALKEKGLIYERVGNYELAIIHYVKIINEEEYNHVYFHKRLLKCLHEINDDERIKKAVDLYFTKKPVDSDNKTDNWFKSQILCF